MTNRLSLSAVAALVLWLPACGSPEPAIDEYSRLIPAAVETGMIGLDTEARARVTLAATLAKAIRADVSDTTAVLAQYKMTMEQFELELYAISMDSRLANAYDIALRDSK